MNNPAIIENAMDYIDAMLTPEEIQESDQRVAIICAPIEEQIENSSNTNC